MILKTLVFFTSCLLLFTETSAQNPEKLCLIRNIVINGTDSTLKFQISDVTQNHKIETGTDYYWYYNNQLNYNTGGYFGKLLHGTYRVFDHQNHMITEGTYQNGVKKGVWKNWYATGNLKSILIYRNGELHGKTEWFNTKGELYRTMCYKNGVKHGNEKYYLTDTVIVNKYRNGKKIVKKEPDFNTNLKTETSKKPEKVKKQPAREMFPKDNTQNTVTKKDSLWWQRIFKKKHTRNTD